MVTRRRRFQNPIAPRPQVGSKIVPPQVNSEMPEWRTWLEPGMLVMLAKSVCLNPSAWAPSWEGKQVLLRENVAWVVPGAAYVIAWPGDVAVYVGEIGRRTVGTGRGAHREALHLFLLPRGPYICPPEVWVPVRAEKPDTGV